jgi:hypothetical protein
MYYIGIDISSKESALCVLDCKGKVAKLPTDPEVISRFVAATGAADRADRLGIRLYRSLVVCRAAEGWLAGGLHRSAARGSRAASRFPQQERP